MKTLLNTLAELNITLEVREGRLQVNAPAGVLTPELRQAISIQKNSLIEMLQAARVEPLQNEPPQIIPHSKNRYAPFPLNDVQHAYWIGRSAQMELGSVATHFYFELECGALEPCRLTEAFRKVLAAHDMLRAVIDVNGMQRVLDSTPPYDIEVQDLREAGREQRENELLRIRAEMSHQVFVPDRWPLFDIRLLQISDKHSRLCMSWDFLVVDAWSLMLIFRQWFNCYQDATAQVPIPSLSFRDYVISEARLKEQAAYRASKKYWWDRLDQLPMAPQLPAEVNIPLGRSHEFKRQRLRIDADQWDRIKARARRSGITPSNVLLSVFCEVLNLWSQVPHYCLNLTLFNRPPLHPEVMSLVGDFTKLMVLEVDARDGCSFLKLCTRIQSQFLRDYDHRQVNGTEVLRELGKRHGGKQTLLPVVFTSTLMLDGKKNDDAAVLEQFGPMGYGISQTPQVWLDYQVFEVNGDLVINWDAVEEVFPPGVLDDMFECHRECLSSLANNPDAWEQRYLASLPKHQLQRQALMNDTAADIASECLHELFVKKAMEYPEKTALIHADGEMSYAELLAHSNAVAQQLMQNGVRPKELVAIVMEKGWEQVVAALGVLIAGAAYLPIEPTWPTLRRNHILEQAEVRFAITQPTLNGALDWPANLHCIEIASRYSLDPVTTAPAIRQSPTDLAYVIFTSGSTGSPKGVMISHRGAVNTIAHINRLFQVGAEDKVLTVSDLTFDLSVFDIFGTLAAGGALVIPKAAWSRDADYWNDLIVTHQVSIWNSAPALMSMLVDACESGSLRHPLPLRLVLLSGDWIPVQLPGRVRQAAPDARVISLGGATEGSIWSIYYPIGEVPAEWSSIPYGRALLNQHMYVLNKALQPCPDLVPGDIYIGGLGVALGYWKDPHKTAQQFIIHPQTGERLYYTGDLGRFQRDGNIEFLGRADSQIKLHGHRVELGEIVAVMQSHSDVRAAAVRVLRPDKRTLLTAYVVADVTGSGRLFEQMESTSQVQTISTVIDTAVTEYCKRVDRTPLQRFRQFWEQVERVSLGAMLETLDALGLHDGSDASGRMRELLESGRILPQYKRLVQRWLATLQDAGLLSRRDGGYIVAGSAVRHKEPVHVQLQRLEQYFGHDESTKGFVEHVTSCLRNHLSLLRGEINPLTLLFPEGSWHVAQALYETNPVVRHHNGLLAQIVSTHAGNWRSDRPLQILEIGAGTGGTSAVVLPSLPADRTEYLYTDASAYFLPEAKKRFASYSFVRYAIYDLNKDPNEQGYQAQSYDLIIAANVLHNAINIGAVLRNTRELLRPGGQVLLLEGTKPTPWMWATVAFLEAANTYTDARAESDQWLVDADEWLRLLGDSGFEDPHAFRPSDSDELSELLTAMPQQVITARAPQGLRFRAEALAAFLRERLPDYMIPQRFVLLDKLPLTPNGKVDFSALPLEIPASAEVNRQSVVPESKTEEHILEIWKDVLGVDQLSATENFFEAGGDSLLLTEVMRRLNRLRQTPLTIAELLSYPTIRSLADHLDPRTNTRGSSQGAIRPPASAPNAANDIAVIGVSGKFPDADTVEQLWQDLAAGKCAVRNFSEDELLLAGVSLEELNNPNYVRAGPVLRHMDLFDASFFGFTPRDAEIMDPQQRFLMECAVDVLDNAGYPNEKHAGRIGVFVGKGTSFYLLENLLPHSLIIGQLGYMPVLNVNEKDHAATLLSYKLNLTGPSVSVNTACSTSLVAVHLACESLLNGKCEMALAGGVSFVNLRASGYLYHEGHIVSPDGFCRAFSEDANGTVFGSGVGLVVLKPLAAALRDRDTIHAVIRGSAINNDGALKLSYSAPSVQGQAEVIAKAQAQAGASPDTIQFLEAHGTGTALGDSIEFAALRQVFGGPRSDGTRCSLGSVKTNIGHLDTAAGITGLIKVVEALKHKQIPPARYANAANGKLDFADSPFELPPVLKEWPGAPVPRRAGVSSFGVGGTNAHVVLEEAPIAQEQPARPGLQVLPVSAKSPQSLKEMMAALAGHFSDHPDLALDDVAFTLQVGRNPYSYRCYIVSDQLSDAQRQFANGARLVTEHRSETPRPTVVFLFPGQGVLQKNASVELYKNEPRFRSAFDECSDIVQQYTGEDPRAWLYTTNAKGDMDIQQSAVAQPLLFSIEYSLARFWETLGVRPTAMLGHSLGEYVAACLSGVFSLSEALSLVVVRGRLVQSLPPGHMLAVSCTEARLGEFLDGSFCCLAAVNAPSQCVASGPMDEIEALHTRLKAAGISSCILRSSHAFHSQMVDPILRTFEQCVSEIERRPPSLPFVSNVTGAWITDAEAKSPQYWARHMRQPVRFHDGLLQVLALKDRVLLELGPGRVLSGLAKQTERSAPAVASLSGERGSESEGRSFLDAVGQLWRRGVDIDWAPLHEGSTSRRIPLPGYRFERRRYWIEKASRVGNAHPAFAGETGGREDGRNRVSTRISENCDRCEPEIDSFGPHGHIEIKLLEIWKSYLGVEQIGIRQSFFEMGGDSLLGARLNAQIRREFNVDLPLARMFELGTIRNLALYIAISRDQTLIDTLPEADLNEVLAVAESWPPETRSDKIEDATTE